MVLEDYCEPLAYETAFWMLGVTNPEYPLDQLGDLSLEVSGKFRALAIITLLVQSEPDCFYHNLIRSALMRETYLKRLHQEKVDGDHHQCSGRYDALVDAIAAGEFDLARRIIRLSPVNWRTGHEYEDDYCYAQILHRLVHETLPKEEVLPLLARFESYLDGEANARFDVCKALIEKDQDVFDEAFEGLLTEQEDLIEQNKERGQLEDPIVIANRFVFIEGLAILRLAEKQGLKTEPEYRYCPSLARVPMEEPFPGE